MEMKCEYPGCNCNEGYDYIRLAYEEEIGWEGEPIFLCGEHDKGRKIIEDY